MMRALMNLTHAERSSGVVARKLYASSRELGSVGTISKVKKAGLASTTGTTSRYSPGVSTRVYFGCAPEQSGQQRRGRAALARSLACVLVRFL